MAYQRQPDGEEESGAQLSAAGEVLVPVETGNRFEVGLIGGWEIVLFGALYEAVLFVKEMLEFCVRLGVWISNARGKGFNHR